MEAFYEVEKEKFFCRTVTSGNGDCILWTGPLTSDRRYGFVSYMDPHLQKRKKKKAHRFCVMLHNNDLDLDSALDCSHLCHNNLCVNRHHLSMEPRHINNNRIDCKNEGTCQGHNGYSDCMLHLTLE